jgi:hypothetical protein
MQASNMRNRYEITYHDEVSPDGAQRRERVTIEDAAHVELIPLIKVAFWIIIPLVVFDGWRKAPIATLVGSVIAVVALIVWGYPRLRRASAWRRFGNRRGRDQ